MPRISMEDRIEKFINGEIRWSVATKQKDKLLPIIELLVGKRFYTDTERNGKYTHFYTKSTPWWEIRNSDIRQLKKLKKQLLNTEGK